MTKWKWFMGVFLWKSNELWQEGEKRFRAAMSSLANYGFFDTSNCSFWLFLIIAIYASPTHFSMRSGGARNACLITIVHCKAHTFSSLEFLTLFISRLFHQKSDILSDFNALISWWLFHPLWPFIFEIFPQKKSGMILKILLES